jgi:adenylate cyclase
MRGRLDEADKIAGLQHARTVLASGTDDATALAVAAFVIAYLGRDHKAGLSASAPCRSILRAPRRSILAG